MAFSRQVALVALVIFAALLLLSSLSPKIAFPTRKPRSSTTSGPVCLGKKKTCPLWNRRAWKNQNGRANAWLSSVCLFLFYSREHFVEAARQGLGRPGRLPRTISDGSSRTPLSTSYRSTSASMKGTLMSVAVRSPSMLTTTLKNRLSLAPQSLLRSIITWSVPQRSSD